MARERRIRADDRKYTVNEKHDVGECCRFLYAFRISAPSRFQTQRFRIVDEAGYLLPILFGADASNYARCPYCSLSFILVFLVVFAVACKRDLYQRETVKRGIDSSDGFSHICAGKTVFNRTLCRSICGNSNNFAHQFLRALHYAEPLYFFGFWLTVWVVLSSVERTTLFSVIVVMLVGLFRLSNRTLWPFHWHSGFFLNP